MNFVYFYICEGNDPHVLGYVHAKPSGYKRKFRLPNLRCEEAFQQVYFNITYCNNGIGKSICNFKNYSAINCNNCKAEIMRPPPSSH